PAIFRTDKQVFKIQTTLRKKRRVVEKVDRKPNGLCIQLRNHRIRARVFAKQGAFKVQWFCSDPMKKLFILRELAHELAKNLTIVSVCRTNFEVRHGPWIAHYFGTCLFKWLASSPEAARSLKWY